jgi:hypothetical protein
MAKRKARPARKSRRPRDLAVKTSPGVKGGRCPDVAKTPTPGGPVPIPYPNLS